MKRILVLATVFLLFCGCNSTSHISGEKPDGDYGMLFVQVNDQVYYTIVSSDYIVSETIPSEKEIAGYITSCYGENAGFDDRFPENNQASFPEAVNQPYVLGDGYLLLLLDGKWVIFDQY